MLLIGLSFSWVFGYGFAKMGINIQSPEHMDCSCISYVNTYAVFFHGLFHNSHTNASFLFFAGLLFKSLLSSGKSFSFFLQIYNPPGVAKKFLFMRVVVCCYHPKASLLKTFSLFTQLFLLIACMLFCRSGRSLLRTLTCNF